jgi:hypothetical protein
LEAGSLNESRLRVPLAFAPKSTRCPGASLVPGWLEASPVEAAGR